MSLTEVVKSSTTASSLVVMAGSGSGQTWLQQTIAEIQVMELSKTSRDRLEFTAMRASKLP